MIWSLPKCNPAAFLIIFLFLLGFSGRVYSQPKTVQTLAGDGIPLDGDAMKALFIGPWQIKVRDSLAFIADKDYNALRELNIRRKKVRTLLTNQTAISALAISRTGDSIFFASNSNVINLYRRSNQSLQILDTLPDGEIDALECKANGTLLIGGGTGHRVILLNKNGTYTVIAGKLNVSGFLDGRDTLARFNRISSLLLSKTEDTLYIADRFNSRIRRWISSSRQVSTLPITLLFGPRQIEFNRRKDTLYIANSSGHTIYRHALKTNLGGHWCGGATLPGYTEGLLTNSRFNFPMGIARCDSGWIICDNSNRRIRMITVGGQVRTFAGVGFIGDGKGLLSRFSTPYDIVKHPKKDTVYVSDQNNHAIRMMDLKTLTVTTIAGNGTPGNVFGTGAVVRLNRPSNMAIHPTGDTLYFVEPFSNKIKLLLTKTLEVKWLAGSDTSGYVDKPQGRFSRFNRPQDISYKDGFLYVADANNHKIRRINIRTTEVTTFAGSSSGFRDSTLLASRFNRPSTLEWVGNRLFIGEDAGLRIRVLLPDSNKVRNWAGSGNIGSVDGFGSNARFKGIFKLTYDPALERLLVAGYLNEGICRYVNTTTPVVGTFINSQGFSDGPFQQAKFTGPLGFWVDSIRKRYVMTDANNQRLREIKWYPNTAPKCNFDTTLLEILEDQQNLAFPNVALIPDVGTTIGDSNQTFAYNITLSPEGSLQNPQLSTEGNLSFSTSPDTTGLVRLRVRMKDSGGTLAFGVDTAIYFKSIRIKPVNDPPVVVIGGDDVGLNSVPRKNAQFLTTSLPGPGNESGQSLQFSIQVSNPSLFEVLPFIENDTLKYTPVSGALGTTPAVLICRDNGGTENGGIDSTLISFNITLVENLSAKQRNSQEWSVFPNPVSEYFSIKGLPPDCRKLCFINKMGQLIAEIKVNPGSTLFQTPSVLNGLYFLKAEGSTSIRARVFIRKE